MSTRTLSGSESQLTLGSPLLPIAGDARGGAPQSGFPTGPAHTRLLSDTSIIPHRKTGSNHAKKLPPNVPSALITQMHLQQFRREHLGSVKAIVDQYSLAGLECCGTVQKAAQFISDSGGTRTSLLNFAAECFLLAGFYEQCLRSTSPLDSARTKRSMTNSPSQSYSQPPSRTGSAKDLAAERERLASRSSVVSPPEPPPADPSQRDSRKVDLQLLQTNVLLRPQEEPTPGREDVAGVSRPFQRGLHHDSVGEMMESDSHMGSDKGSERCSPDQQNPPPPPPLIGLGSDVRNSSRGLLNATSEALKSLKAFFPKYRLINSSSFDEIESAVETRPASEQKQMIVDLLQVVGRLLPGLELSATLDSEVSAPGTPVRHMHTVPSMNTLPIPRMTTSFEEGEDAAGFPMINGYTIVDRAGKGSHGTVIIAVTPSGEQRAIKQVRKARLRQKWANVLRAGLPSHNGQTPRTPEAGGAEDHGADVEATGKSHITAFHHEIAVMKKIRHQNVVPLIEVIDDPQEDMLFLVMPYIERGPLLQLTPQGTCAPLDVDVVRGYMRQLLEGLQYLHERHIVHRDIKPDNILLGADGKVYLADFGVSHMFDPDVEEFVDNCEGTLAFMAPECFSSTKVAAKPVDVWALGVTFYVMLFGHLPFEGGTRTEIREAITSGDVLFPPVEAFAKDTQADYHAAILLVSKMLCKAPEQRISVHRCRKHAFISRVHHLGRSKTAGVAPTVTAEPRGSTASGTSDLTPTASGKPPRPKARSPSRQRFPPWSALQSSSVQSSETLAQSSDSGDDVTAREPSTINFTASFFSSSTVESNGKEPGSPFSFGEASQNSCMTDSQRKSIDVQVTADEERDALVTRGPIRSASFHALDTMFAEGVLQHPAGLPPKQEPQMWKYTRRRTLDGEFLPPE